MARVITGQTGNVNVFTGGSGGSGGGSDVFGTGQFVYFSASTTWTVPEGITRIRVVCFGAGGGGGDPYRNYNAPSTTITTANNGGEGGPGSFSCGLATVVPEESVPVSVGVGGNAAQAGGTSSCKGVTAGGGRGGTNGTSVGQGGNGSGGIATGGISNFSGDFGESAVISYGKIPLGGARGTAVVGMPISSTVSGGSGRDGWVVIEY